MSTARFNTLQDADGNNGIAQEVLFSGSSKAWANIDGTGAVNLRVSFNCASVVDAGTGAYTLNLTNAMSSTLYMVSLSAGGGGVAGGVTMDQAFARTSSAIRFGSLTTAGANTDADRIEPSIFGDLA